MKRLRLFAAASLLAAPAPVIAQFESLMLPEKAPAIALERAVALSQACKEYVDAMDGPVNRFEELELKEASDVDLPKDFESFRRFAATDATVSVGVRNARVTEGDFGYRPEKETVLFCSVRFVMNSLNDSDMLRNKISATLGKTWVIYRGQYRIDYSKKRLVQFVTSLGSLRTDVQFAKTI